MEHVVRRAGLVSTESSLSASASPELGVLEKFKDLAQFDFVTSNASDDYARDRMEVGDDESLEFQLFAAPKARGDQSVSETGEGNRIRLRSPSLDPERIGFVQPHRSQGYYFTDALSVGEQQILQSAALTGDQVLALSNTPRPGSECAWKVLHLPPSGLSKDLQLSQLSTLPRLTGDEQTKKRTRPGKKYRIKLRKRLVASQAQKDAKKAAQKAKEAAEQEKRTRRNREKKVKKKAKEKAKKEGKEVGDEVEGDDYAPAE